LPVLLVDSYCERGTGVAAMVQNLARRQAEGYGLFKVHTPAASHAARAILDAARDALGSSAGLVVDLAMGCQSRDAAIALMHGWHDVRPAWVEDALRAERAEDLRYIRDVVDVPVGAGDEVASESAMSRLVETEAVDVVRLDATCHGGITGFLSFAQRASAKGLRVSAHTYPEIHTPCALALDALDHVEAFADASRYDCAGAFVVRSGARLAAVGRICGDDRPGIGLEFDWGAIARNTVRSTSSASDE
jgi:L-alanine-DL-glutamate epimerase-like enolase superfamily enzyme